ncbi:hypothetical protein ACOACO_17470 [Nocardioides sp. CPCC 205120]|uniref:hypothetical protein n=1 Tax=Nocardioides sp. CPCC 205120 TaxID=3406462 RepID=UPI003B5132A8
MTDLNDIKAGEYVLVALRWDEITSEPGRPLDFTRHRQGDTVTLNVGDAKRLWAAGAIRKPGEKSDQGPSTGPSVAPGRSTTEPSSTPKQTPAKKVAAQKVADRATPPADGSTQEPTADEKADAVLADPSSSSVKDVLAALEHRGNDADAAAKVLELEQAGQKRPMLVKGLEKILNPSGDGDQGGGDAS